MKRFSALIFFIFFVRFSVICAPITLNEVCDLVNKRVYLPMGGKGSLITDNISNRIPTSNILKNVKCTLEIISCPSCIIEATIRSLDIQQHCANTSIDEDCSCNYLLLYEAFYPNVSAKKFCGQLNNDEGNISFKTKSKSLVVRFFGNFWDHYSFDIDFASQRNRIYLTDPIISNETLQTISTPYFPYRYPIDLFMEFVINCEDRNECNVAFLFTDFLLSTASTIEFYEWNGEKITFESEGFFRPPLITTKGPILLVRFYANGQTHFGFKAEYYFRTNNLFKPITDCGGIADNLGGAITMMHMIKKNSGTYYDCYWIIRPPQNQISWKTDIYLRISQFSDFNEGSALTVREGITSEGQILENFVVLNTSITLPITLTVPINKGFYVSLKGFLTSKSQLTMIYAAYSYKDCFLGSNFMCGNRKCISILLVCDGFDHCGDNSDELKNCSLDGRYFHKMKGPNYYFPKSHYYDLRLTLVVLLICGIIVVSVIFGSMLLIYRMNTRVQSHRRFQQHMQTINAILEENNYHGEEVEIIISDDPPNYEAPPTYEEVAHMAACNRTKVHKNRAKIESQAGSSRVTTSRSPPPAYQQPKTTSPTVDEPAMISRSLLTKWLNAEDIRSLWRPKLISCFTGTISLSDNSLNVMEDQNCFGRRDALRKWRSEEDFGSFVL